jgi:hypothetical protein
MGVDLYAIDVSQGERSSIGVYAQQGLIQGYSSGYLDCGPRKSSFQIKTLPFGFDPLPRAQSRSIEPEHQATWSLHDDHLLREADNSAVKLYWRFAGGLRATPGARLPHAWGRPLREFSIW